jgi:hypothetical protein
MIAAMRGLLVVALAVLVPGVASAQVLRSFQTPSRNIGCLFVGPQADGEQPYLRCDIGSGLHPVPRRPKECFGDFGIAVGMTNTGRAGALCVGDSARDPRAPVLGYGSTWRRSGFTCVSRPTGLRCTNAAGHGWMLSRERSAIF